MGILIKELTSDGITYQEYLKYIETCKGKLLPSAYEYASASWHYDMTDPRCIHDAWLLECSMQEASSDQPGNRPRSFKIETSFLSGLEDKVLRFVYTDVIQYSLQMASGTEQFPGHSEVYFDEIRLSSSENVIHEILYMSNTRWIIECKSFAFLHG